MVAVKVLNMLPGGRAQGKILGQRTYHTLGKPSKEKPEIYWSFTNRGSPRPPPFSEDW